MIVSGPPIEKSLPENQNEDQKRIARNWLLSLASWAVPLGLTFVATPIVVRGLGTEQYGLYAVILGYLSAAFSTGVGKLSAKYIPEYRAARSPDDLSKSLSATVFIAFGLGILQAVVLAVAAPAIARGVLLLSGESEQAVVLGLRVAAITGLVMINSQVFQFAAQGLHRFGIYSGLTIFSAAISSVGNIVLVLAGAGMIGLLVWNAVTSVMIGILFFLICKPLIPEWRFNWNPGREMFRQAVVYAGSIIVYQGVTSILYAFERSLVIRRFGAESVSFYVIPLMLAMYLHAFVGSFVQVLFPVVNELIADRERLIAVYLRSTRIVFLITAFFVASYIGSGSAFLGLWLGTEFGIRSGDLLTILALCFGLNAISMIVWLLVEAFKAPIINAFSSSLWTLASIALMVWAGMSLGLEGIALARLAGVVLTIPLIFMIERRFLGNCFTGFWASLVFKGLMAATASYASQVVVLKFAGTSWPSFLASALTGSAVYFVALLGTRLVRSAEIKEVFGAVFSKRSNATSSGVTQTL